MRGGRNEPFSYAPPSAASGGAPPNSSAPRSLLDIQAEQERDRHRRPQQQQQQQQHRMNSPSGGRGPPSQQRRGGGSRSGNSPSSDPNRYARLPLEQGVVCTLKDAFGFIHCADRDEEIFFHYSEVQGMHPADLHVDDEVEFKVGTSSNNSDKLAAFQVKKLETGTIVWDMEEEPGRSFRGLVETSTRLDRVNNSTMDGTIRVLIEKTDPNGEAIDAPEGPLVRFSTRDYTPRSQDDNDPPKSSSPLSRSNAPRRLTRGDLVEFTIVTVKRTKDRHARNIKLLLSERERVRHEQEQKMLEEATEEHGVVTTLKGEYGFLRSNKRREDVYFHYSSIRLMDSDGDDNDFVLKEGQEMKFLVVNEGSDDGPNRRISARQLKLQPRGSVRFHDTLASGVTGTVVMPPQPVDSGHSLDLRGKVRLNDPLMDVDEDGNDRTISEVYLSPQESPGGIYSFRGGSSAATWVQAGDTLLFDVVKDFVDGACHASPTRHLVPNPTPLKLEDETGEADQSRRVRLIDLSLMGRAEGVVNAVKDAYGFIHFAERPADVHFKLHQILPDELQADVRRNQGWADVDTKGKALKLCVDAEVQFDISVHGTIHGHNGGRHRGRQLQSNERENLKAQRVLLLPPGTISFSKVMVSGLQTKISKVDLKQPYAGTIDLEEPLQVPSSEERHPLIAKMIDTYLASSDTAPLVYHDIQSMKEDTTIIEMLQLKGGGKLAWSHIPVSAEPSYPGRLCIRKVEGDDEKNAQAESEDEALEAQGIDVDADDNDAEEGGESSKRKQSLKTKKPFKQVKSIRYDKGSLGPELRDDFPPGVGDVVEIDIVHNRRTNQVCIENMRIIERNASEGVVVETSAGMGVVTEVLNARNFGFIALLDEAATRREALFFSWSTAKVGDGDGVSPKKKPPFRKGDEVKFDIVTERNGKRVAVNVSLLPNGTIPSKPDPNACKGLVLLEPASSTLKHSQVRHTNSSHSSGELSGRWNMSVSDEGRKKGGSIESAAADGCILLLEDPASMFADKAGRTNAGQSDQKHDQGNGLAEGASPDTPDEGPTSTDQEVDSSLGTLRHLKYKTGAIAIHGAGSTDDSSNPKRGDLVSFVKAKSGKGLRDIRIVKRAAATMVRGRLENIEPKQGDNSDSIGTATFITATDQQDAFTIELSEVVSCDPSILKDKEPVEGILHEGSMYGVCRTADLYLETKLGGNRKERTKLNLTVKKDRAGTIMAQSMMAKGPDGTNGFASGWTGRRSKFAATDGAGQVNGNVMEENAGLHESDGPGEIDAVHVDES